MLRTLVFLITLSIALTAYSQSPEPSSDKSSDKSSDNASDNASGQKQSEQPAGSASVLYYRDPQTGKVTTPPPEVARALQPDSRMFSTEGLEMEVMANGTKKVDLRGRFMMTSVVKHDKEGDLVHYCTDHPGELTDAEHVALHKQPVEK